ncbi:MAG: nucleotidyltransferase family protein [Clostridia bacterium]|nr:nucleotidyltransferase family protein [Clostridia bacterium]
MKTVGIVCEYNPFHNGHAHQIELLRQNGFELVVCAMSGNFTQRGELAIADKYTRAESAVRCGADIVVELPFPFSSFSAEGFSRAGVHILSSLGVDTLSFGSESADLTLLSRAADAACSDEFISAYSKADKGVGAARAYFDTLSRFVEGDLSPLSNDILGISYLSAIKDLGVKMDVFPIKREGASYNERTLSDTENPSATALRGAVKDNESGFFSISSSSMPKEALTALQAAQNEGKAPVFSDGIGKEIISFFSLLTPAEIISRAISRSGGGDFVAEDGCGIVDRLCNATKNTRGLNEFLKKAYNSRYTDARINRVALFALLGVSNRFSKAVPEYTTLLAASEKGRTHLAKIRKSSAFPIITKPADAPDGCLTKILRASDALYARAMSDDIQTDHFLKKHPFLSQ